MWSSWYTLKMWSNLLWACVFTRFALEPHFNHTPIPFRCPMKKSNQITPTYVRVQVQEAWGPEMALLFILKIGFSNLEGAPQDLLGKWCHRRATLVFQSWIQSLVCVPWIHKPLHQKGHSILEFLWFCTLVCAEPLYTWPRAKTMKYKGLWKPSKIHSMWDINSILQSVGPQAYCRVKVDHVEGTQHKFKLRSPSQ